MEFDQDYSLLVIATVNKELQFKHIFNEQLFDRVEFRVQSLQNLQFQDNILLFKMIRNRISKMKNLIIIFQQKNVEKGCDNYFLKAYEYKFYQDEDKKHIFQFYDNKEICNFKLPFVPGICEYFDNLGLVMVNSLGEMQIVSNKGSTRKSSIN